MGSEMCIRDSAMVAPSVFKFHKASEFLKAHYEYRKRIDPGFSYDAWSAELGYKSRSFLKMLASGQRSMTMDFVDNFSQKMQFSKEDGYYFSLLVSHEQAETEHEKSVYLDKIFEQRGRRESLQLLSLIHI